MGASSDSRHRLSSRAQLDVLLIMRNRSRVSTQPHHATWKSPLEVPVRPGDSPAKRELNRFNFRIYVADIKVHTGTYLHIASRS
jgi:hypothetical protein